MGNHKNNIAIDFEERIIKRDLFTFALLKVIFCSAKEKFRIMRALTGMRRLRKLGKKYITKKVCT